MRANLVGISLPVVVLTIAVPVLVAAAEVTAPPQPGAIQVVDQFQKNQGVFPGYRRNHAKGVCVSGYFQSHGGAAPYSMAQVFAPARRTPVVGRFSIPGTNPYAWDDSTPIRGMALSFTLADGESWRTAMNAVPAFPVSTPRDDYEFMRAQQPDPATGEPDPQTLARFFATHPKATAFRDWVAHTKPSTSFATVRYNSLDAFEFVDAHGRRYAVRWSMLPEATADAHPAPADNPDYLAADLRQRLSRGPLRWQLSVTLARPGDPTDDAARAWPANRRHIDAGTLVIDASQTQQSGPCRDINFDPLVLPAGIEPSDDPLLRFRAAAYAESHLRRTREEAQQDAAARVPGSDGSEP